VYVLLNTPLDGLEHGTFLSPTAGDVGAANVYMHGIFQTVPGAGGNASIAHVRSLNVFNMPPCHHLHIDAINLSPKSEGPQKGLEGTNHTNMVLDWTALQALLPCHGGTLMLKCSSFGSHLPLMCVAFSTL